MFQEGTQAGGKGLSYPIPCTKQESECLDKETLSTGECSTEVPPYTLSGAGATTADKCSSMNACNEPMGTLYVLPAP